MTILQDMLALRRSAEHARCRVTCWKIDDVQVWELAEFLAPLEGVSVIALVDRFCRGNVSVLGARVKVVFPDCTRTRFA